MKAALLLVVLTFVLIQTVRCQLVGGQQPAQLSEEEKNKLIKYAHDAFLQLSESPNHFKVVRVNGITSQVVSGVIYRLNLEFGETTCQKGSGGNNCPLKDSSGSKTMKCEIQVYERPWENFRETKVNSCVG